MCCSPLCASWCSPGACALSSCLVGSHFCFSAVGSWFRAAPAAQHSPASLTGVGAGINLVTLGSTLGLNKEDTTSSSSFHCSELGRDQLLTWNSPQQAARCPWWSSDTALGREASQLFPDPGAFPFLIGGDPWGLLSPPSLLRKPSTCHRGQRP